MDVNSKVKELEDELKVLKAEIRNSLLDIREVILERKNPLGEEHESAFIRMDLNTTARAMAAEAVGKEAAKATAESEDEKAKKDEKDEKDGDEPTDDSPPKGKASRKKKGAKSDTKKETEQPDKPAEDAPPDPSDIPPMYLKTPPPIDGSESLAAWIATALGTVGPQQLERVIAVRRLWGDLPPSTCEALARLEELIHASKGQELSWLRTLQILERLTPSQ